LKLVRDLSMVRGHRIHSIRAGSGPDVVLLHGLAGSSSWWRYTMPELGNHFTLHAPDLVGFGRSRGTPLVIADMAALVVEWMQLAGLTRAHIIGHSMGGQIAIHMAARHEEHVDKLVLVSAAGIPRRISLVQAAQFFAEIVPPRAWGTKRFLPRIAIDALRAGPLAVAHATAIILRDDVRALLPAIRVPTLLIWGSLDPLTPLRDGTLMVEQIEGARLIVFDEAAHIPMVDQPERFNSEVLAFLRA
jgi:pimeloyl-ACP methyl ester carboxylesterase